jgi:hypothetical protein
VGRIGPPAARPINERAAADNDVTAGQGARIAENGCEQFGEACAQDDQVDDDTNDDSKQSAGNHRHNGHDNSNDDNNDNDDDDRADDDDHADDHHSALSVSAAAVGSG